MDTDQKVIAKFKQQIADKELTYEDLAILLAAQKFLESYGWDKFKDEKAYNVNFNEETKEGSFFINIRKNGKIVRAVFTVKSNDEEIIIEVKVVEVDANYYKKED